MWACCKIKEHFLQAWNVMLALNITQPVSELAYFLSIINCSANFKSVFHQQKKKLNKHSLFYKLSTFVCGINNQMYKERIIKESPK